MYDIRSDAIIRAKRRNYWLEHIYVRWRLYSPPEKIKTAAEDGRNYTKDFQDNGEVQYGRCSN